MSLLVYPIGVLYTRDIYIYIYIIGVDSKKSNMLHYHIVNCKDLIWISVYWFVARCQIHASKVFNMDHGHPPS